MRLENSREELLESGYTILKSVISPSELQQIRALTDEIIKYNEVGYEDPFEKYFMPHRTDQGALYDLFYRHPEFSEVARNPHKF